MTKDEEIYKDWLIERIKHHNSLLREIAQYRLHCDNNIIVELQQHMANYHKLTGKKYK